MPAQPRLYRYDDAGAPQPANYFDAFYQVAKAVLVDGYGSQLAAGWSMVYDEWATLGHAQFTNAVRSGVLGLVKDDGGSPEYWGCSLFMADAMVDATTAVNARSGIKSIPAISALNSTANRMGVCSSSVYRYWAAIANENFAIFWFAHSRDGLFSASASTISSDSQMAFAVGATRNLRGLGGISDASLGNFAVIGGYYNSSSGSSWNLTGTVFQLRDKNGSVITTDQYGLCLQCHSGYDNYGVSVADSIVDFHAAPLELWQSIGTTSTSYFSQTAIAPMLLASRFFMQGGNIYTPTAGANFAMRLSSSLLTAEVSLDGRPCVVAPLPGSMRLIVSMAIEDWL